MDAAPFSEDVNPFVLDRARLIGYHLVHEATDNWKPGVLTVCNRAGKTYSRVFLIGVERHALPFVAHACSTSHLRNEPCK